MRMILFVFFSLFLWYAPYYRDWDWNKCKSRAQVLTDLTLLRRLTNRIRILSLVDCDQGVLVTSVARELGMQLWLGLWVAPESYVFEEEGER